MVRCPPFLKRFKMQYWKKSNSGRVQRIEEEEAKKHPEKIENLKEQGYTRIQSETDDKAYSPPKKRYKRKKKK